MNITKKEMTLKEGLNFVEQSVDRVIITPDFFSFEYDKEEQQKLIK